MSGKTPNEEISTGSHRTTIGVSVEVLYACNPTSVQAPIEIGPVILRVPFYAIRTGSGEFEASLVLTNNEIKDLEQEITSGPQFIPLNLRERKREDEQA